MPEKVSDAPYLSAMFDSGEFTDCKIECGEREFNCHKMVLAGRSDVLKAMLESNMIEGLESRIRITDFDETIIEKLVSYMYKGRVEVLKDEAENLLAAAEKYNLDGLKAVCEDTLALSMSADNAVDLLLLADMYNASLLREKVLRYIFLSKTQISQQLENVEKLCRNPKVMSQFLSMTGF